MNLHILVIIDSEAPQGVAEWFFDNHAHFLRAVDLARATRVYITHRTDFTSGLDAFKNWTSNQDKFK